MRLLQTAFLQFEEFEDDKIPKYAILSHCWEGNEISYQDMCVIIVCNQSQSGNTASHIDCMERRRSYAKILHFRCKARAHSYDYVWIDTCCIDKRSSAELQESINSMFQWYQDSAVCYAYLHDALFPRCLSSHSRRGQPLQARYFGAESKWFSRGWTLQEAIAPRKLIFYDKNWKMGGLKIHKTLLKRVCQEFHKVANSILRHHEQKFQKFGVARRMSWAAGRQTTRTEDRAYSLIGLFDVSMTTIYGEKTRAFQRLQEETMKVTDDASILAWHNTKEDTDFAPNGLAKSPDNFANHKGTKLLPLSFEPHLTPRGLKATLRLVKDPYELAFSYAVLMTANRNADPNLKSLVVPLLFPETATESLHPKACLKFSDPVWVPATFIQQAESESVCFLRQPRALQLCKKKLGFSLSSEVWKNYITTFTYPMQTQSHRRHFPAIFGGFSNSRVKASRGRVFIAEVESRASPKERFVIIVKYQVNGRSPVSDPHAIVIRRKKNLDLNSAIQLAREAHGRWFKQYSLLSNSGKISNREIIRFSFFQDFWLQAEDDRHETPLSHPIRPPITKELAVMCADPVSPRIGHQEESPAN